MKVSKRVDKILQSAGVEIGGPLAHDPVIHDPGIFARIARGGSLALGEAYMDELWDVEDLAEFFERVTSIRDQGALRRVMNIGAWQLRFRSFLSNLQSRSRATQVAEQHYDPYQDIYPHMLDSTMSYTCGYWAQADNLADAQHNKHDLVCRKIGLQSGDRVLDIGCGYGSFARHAAEHYGALVTGISVSQGQLAVAEKMTPYSTSVEYRFQDYRDVTGQFDHIVSIGMFEAVGAKNFRTYMEAARRLLKPEGLFLLHTIGARDSTFNVDPWLEKYIFKNGMLPSLAQLASASEELFVIEDVHNFGADYDRTLCAWWDNFENAWSNRNLNRDVYTPTFYRMWKYYLLMCAGTFRSRKNQLYQVLLSPEGVRGGYTTVR